MEIADARLREAEVLLKAGHFASAIYLAGYSVECYLKMAICVTLGWDELLGTFKTHDLEGLLAHSGFDSELRKDPQVKANFMKIVGVWVPDSIRYGRPSDLDEKAASLFMKYVADAKTGVVPWLRKAIS
ncbi:MAG: HEPN domain-containing protein [Proteobacteria bacterium]|nr:HEPN domain-containing protein [Pseudomonadota bacterium]